MLSLLALVAASENFEGYSYYLGDPHAHTGVSGDGGSADLGNCTGHCGNVADVFDLARAAGLDWLALTDHINGVDAADPLQYDSLFQAVLAANNPGVFVTLPAAELWFQQTPPHDFGHKTLLLFGENDQLSSMHMEDLQFNGTGTRLRDCQDIRTWAASLAATAGPLLLVPHHPAVSPPMATDWGCHDNEFEPIVEVYSEHGNSMHEDFHWDPPVSNAIGAGTVEVALDPERFALKMGFAAGTDSHDTAPGSVCDLDDVRREQGLGGGLTVVVLEEGATFDRDTIYEAFRSHSTYATTGPLFPVRLIWRVDGEEQGGLGAELERFPGQAVTVELRLPPELSPWVLAAELVYPGGSKALEGGEGSWTGELPATVPWGYVQLRVDGGSWYAGACADSGSDTEEWLWLSPSWVTELDTDLDGDGYGPEDGDCAEGNASISPAASEVWYDQVDQNCDGNDDDQDGDGYGRADDCADTLPELNPGATEIWYDGVDQNCDGRDDDRDGDGLLASADCDDQDPDPCCGCQSAPSRSALWGLLCIAAWRRRKTE